MKQTTEVWYRLESVGRPEHTVESKATVDKLIRTLAEWLLKIYMGSKIRITVARTQEELAEQKSGPPADLMADLERIMAEGGSDGPEE